MKTIHVAICIMLLGAVALAIEILDQPAPAQPAAGWRLSTLDAGRSQAGALPPTAAGQPWPIPVPAPELLPDAAAMQPDDSGQPGSHVRGRVSGLYYRVQEGMFVAAQFTPSHQRELDRLHVEIEVPERLKTGATVLLTRVDAEFADVAIGDVVGIRLAHKHQPKTFPVRETTRVTAVIARRYSNLARAYEMRIAARKSGHAVAAMPTGETLSQALGAAQ